MKDKREQLWDEATEKLDNKKLANWLSFCYGEMKSKMTRDNLDRMESKLKELGDDNE